MTNYEWSNKTVLVVEDENINFRFIEEILKRTQIKVMRAKNGVEAVNITRSNPDISIILMDIKLPLIDGYEATRQIRAFNKDVPIIAQTAFALAGEKEKSLHAGCTDYLAKPLRINDLLEIMSKYLDSN